MVTVNFPRTLVNYEPGNDDVLTWGLDIEYSILQGIFKMYMPLDCSEFENCIEVNIEKVEEFDGTYDGCNTSEWESYSLNMDVTMLHQLISGYVVFHELNWGN